MANFMSAKSFSLDPKPSKKTKKKKRTRVSSDWLSYTGSNDILNEDIKKGHQIRKEILHLCSSKGWCSWYESKEIFNRDALLDDKYYNHWISCKIRKNHLK